MTIVVVCYIY